MGLSLMERRLLILANGKRDITAIARFMNGSDIVAISRKLSSNGLLLAPEAAETKPVSFTNTQKESSNATGQITVVPDPDKNDSDENIMNIMIAALDLLSAPKASQGIRQKILGAENDEELKELIEQWFAIISANKQHTKKADMYREQVDKTIMSNYLILF